MLFGLAREITDSTLPQNVSPRVFLYGRLEFRMGGRGPGLKGPTNYERPPLGFGRLQSGYTLQFGGGCWHSALKWQRIWQCGPGAILEAKKALADRRICPVPGQIFGKFLTSMGVIGILMPPDADESGRKKIECLFC